MKIQWFDNLIDKIMEYLPDEEAANEEERLYEEGKQRIYHMHETEADIFYIEETWLEEGSFGNVYGETAKGSFQKGDKVILLDVHGESLLEEEIVGVKEENAEEMDPNQGTKKFYFHFDAIKFREKEDLFVRGNYLIKKH